MAGSAFDFSTLLPDAFGVSGKAATLRAVLAEATRPAPPGTRITPLRPRVAAERAAYAGRPDAYFRDILGVTLTPQQEEALALMERETRVLLPSANNQGKTFLVAGYGIYILDAVAALPDPETGQEQGGRVLLPGPDHDTVFETIYAEMLTHAARAEALGHRMPGERSERSVLWRVRPKWHVEVLTPPRRVGQNVMHTASGRHHRNQVALIEEGQGVEEALWRAAEGMCSSAGNKIVSPFNPTEPVGPAYQRAQSGAYAVLHLDAFDHPNVRERRPAIPDAVDFRVIDARVRADCRDRGPARTTPLEPEHGDFVYALPPIAADGTPAPEQGPRHDGVLGHPDGEPRVYRPSGPFVAQVRGRWPAQSDGGLFDAQAWDAAVARWAERADPAEAPDRVGVDPAREGDDESCAAPAWGEAADALLRACAAAQSAGTLAQLQATRRVRVGELVVLQKGKGPETAAELVRRFPRSPFAVDEGGVGSSPYDFLVNVHRRDAAAVSFGAAPLPRVGDLEPWCENLRTQLYVRAALLVARGLADVPDDPLLREEVLAHRVTMTTRTAEVRDPKTGHVRKERVAAVALIPKDEVKRAIGRSPDRADAFVLSLFAAPVRAQTARPVLSRSYQTI